MDSGSPETSIRTAPQKHSPEYFAITVSLPCSGKYMPAHGNVIPERSYTVGKNAERRLAPGQVRCRLLARNGPPAMSAVWSLSGGKRTWRLRAPTCVFDATETVAVHCATALTPGLAP